MSTTYWRVFLEQVSRMKLRTKICSGDCWDLVQGQAHTASSRYSCHKNHKGQEAINLKMGGTWEGAKGGHLGVAGEKKRTGERDIILFHQNNNNYKKKILKETVTTLHHPCPVS